MIITPVSLLSVSVYHILRPLFQKFPYLEIDIFFPYYSFPSEEKVDMNTRFYSTCLPLGNLNTDFQYFVLLQNNCQIYDFPNMGPTPRLHFGLYLEIKIEI